MDIYDMIQPEKFDLLTYNQLASLAPKIRDSHPDVADRMEAQRPTVLAAAIYDDIFDGDGAPGVVQLVKWNRDIWEYGVCEFKPYHGWIDTNDTSPESVRSCIAQFTEKSRNAGARTLMIRAALPKP